MNPLRTKEWVEAFTLEEDMQDPAAGLLKDNLSSFAEPNEPSKASVPEKTRLSRNKRTVKPTQK